MTVRKPVVNFLTLFPIFLDEKMSPFTLTFPYSRQRLKRSTHMALLETRKVCNHFFPNDLLIEPERRFRRESRKPYADIEIDILGRAGLL